MKLCDVKTKLFLFFLFSFFPQYFWGNFPPDIEVCRAYLRLGLGLHLKILEVIGTSADAAVPSSSHGFS